MQILLPARTDARPGLATMLYGEARTPEPHQLSFLSPNPGATVGEPDNPHEHDPEIIHNSRRLRRRPCKSLKPADVAAMEATHDGRALLQKPNGETLPPLLARIDSPDGPQLHPATAADILDSADALLAHRFRRGVKILRDPWLLLRFLRIRLVTQRQPVFAAFFLDRKQRLIRFTELARGETDRVRVYPREVIREALACGAEQIFCVRSDPIGDHQPTSHDIEDARRVKRALDLLLIPLLDYVIVGEGVTSLLQRRVI
jgi:DNA repair protein RadC